MGKSSALPAHRAIRTLSDKLWRVSRSARAKGALNPTKQPIREEILAGLLPDNGGEAQISTAMPVLAEIIASDMSLLVTLDRAI